MPEAGSSGGTKEYINNTKSKYGFQFNGILPMSTTQDEVFKKVGQAAVNNVLGRYYINYSLTHLYLLTYLLIRWF